MAEKTLEELREAMVRTGREYYTACCILDDSKTRFLTATRAYYDAKAAEEQEGGNDVVR